MQIAIINGPNLNLLGKREPEIYGHASFEDFLIQLKKDFPQVTFFYFQSNIEGELIDKIQETATTIDALILNAAAYTHTSVGIADAVKALDIPVIEVHISNVWKRETYRHTSYLSPHVLGVIAGFGLESYKLAVAYLINQI